MDSKARNKRLATAVACVVCSLELVGGAECVGFRVDHYKQYAEVVFSGTVRKMKQLDSARTVLTFDVAEVWKGEVGNSFVIHQLIESIDSFRFPIDALGEKHVVFATRLDADQLIRLGLKGSDIACGFPTCGGATRVYKQG